MKVCSELKNRGVQDTLIAWDSRMPSAPYSQKPEYNCASSIQYVAYKDQKAFMRDLKRVYGAESREIAMQNPERLMDEWKKYGVVLDNWWDKRENLSTYFSYGYQIHCLIYTTNIVEGFNRRLRKVTKSKALFPNDEALKKTLYLSTQNIVKKWSMPYRDWGETYGQFAIEFGDRAKVA